MEQAIAGINKGGSDGGGVLKVKKLWLCRILIVSCGGEKINCEFVVVVLGKGMGEFLD